MTHKSKLPFHYNKITKDWSFSCSSVTHWNDMGVYSVVGIKKRKKIPVYQIDNINEYVLRGENRYIYVNADECYDVINFKGDFIDEEKKLYKISFDIINYIGKTPNERVIIISGYDYCIYALGREYWRKVTEDEYLRNESPFKFRNAWIRDRQEVISPITEKMHTKIDYSFTTRRTYNQYLSDFNYKCQELGLI